jgi:shikimate kinase
MFFQHHSEAYFREKERDLITQFPLQNTVIATGGGMPCFVDNMSLLKQKGRLIYLKASEEYLHQNLKQDLNQRPLLKEVSNLLLHIREQLAIRESYYNQADLILDVAKIYSVEDFVK